MDFFFRIFVVMGVFLCSNVPTFVKATAPIARHMYVRVAKGAEVVIRLNGYDVDGDSLTATITSLPASGSLHQLSQVFNDYGYEPKKGSDITQASTVVTGSNSRLLYKRPVNDNSVVGQWTTFKYQVSDGTTNSVEGIVTLVDTAHDIVVGSDFSTDSESWTIVNNNAVTSQPTYEPSTRGPMKYYIYGTDDAIHTDSNGNDRRQWYFNAPAKFLGKKQITYGGKLEFHVSSSMGDFSSNHLNNQLDFVVLECSTCNINQGITLVQRLSPPTTSFDGTTTKFSYTLTESGGWLKDPKNTLLTWNKPTQCEMVDVLAGLTSVKILGDHTKWYESVSLDTVNFTFGSSSSPIPISCYPN